MCQIEESHCDFFNTWAKDVLQGAMKPVGQDSLDGITDADRLHAPIWPQWGCFVRVIPVTQRRKPEYQFTIK